jgi:L-cysteine S-thiosulfotransferase
MIAARRAASRRRSMWLRFLVLLGCVPAFAAATLPQQPQPLKSGIEFQSAETRALQADEFGNPGMLWVARGERLWSQSRGDAGNSCESCHGDARKSMKGVAASYPRHGGGQVMDLEQRINACVTGNQRGRALPWESEDLLALTAYVARQSRGSPIDVAIDGPARETFERGRRIYFERQGQLNLACTQCHDANWGRTLLAEKVSQGHPADWPAYRLEWQSLGSLQRRLRACYFGVRAELPQFGSPDLVALELYLAARARGLPLSVPGVRR